MTRADMVCPSPPLTSSLSLVEQRRDALLQWLGEFSDQKDLNGVSERADCTLNSTGGCGGTATVESEAGFEACYDSYLRCDNSTMEEKLYTRLLDALDKQCHRQGPLAEEAGLRSKNHSAQLAGSAFAIRIPDRLVVPRRGASNMITAPSLPHRCSNSENLFEKHVRRVFPCDSAAVAKQLIFQDALLSIREVLDMQGIPFFLACGTALGARRNGCFIPYDEDIDLGVMYSVLCSKTPHTANAAAGEEDVALPSFAHSNLQRAQDRLYRLMLALASDGSFLVFDVCGAVEKGLELRVLHTPSNARIDINLYYPPVPGSDDALIRAGGPFVWASSFYEAANQRAHQMYRYHHRPFDAELTQLPFCIRTPDAEGFWVPPVRYLVENYGSDWETPKQYSYKEGLSREFRNIIAE
jgi:hypothetical protein